MPSEFQSKEAPLPSEFQDAARGMGMESPNFLQSKYRKHRRISRTFFPRNFIPNRGCGLSARTSIKGSVNFPQLTLFTLKQIIISLLQKKTIRGLQCCRGLMMATLSNLFSNSLWAMSSCLLWMASRHPWRRYNHKQLKRTQTSPFDK